MIKTRSGRAALVLLLITLALGLAASAADWPTQTRYYYYTQKLTIERSNPMYRTLLLEFSPHPSELREPFAKLARQSFNERCSGLTVAVSSIDLPFDMFCNSAGLEGQDLDWARADFWSEVRRREWAQRGAVAVHIATRVCIALAAWLAIVACFLTVRWVMRGQKS